MIGAVVGLVAVAIGLYLIVTATGKAQRSTELPDLMQRVPTITVGELVARPACPADIESIIESMDQEFRGSNGWTEGTAASSIALLRKADPGRLGYIAVDDPEGTTIGFGTVDQVLPALSRCSVGFSMRPAFRSQGLGTAALSAVLEAVHRAGVDTIEIGTRESNQAMASCIARAGGTQVRRQPVRLADGSTPMSLWFHHSATEFS